MIVSHKYRFIFLRTEKTASTSLSDALRPLLGPEDEEATLERPAWSKYSPIHHGALKRTFPTVFGPHPHATAAQARAVVGRRIFDSYFKFAVERNPWERQLSLYTHREWKKDKGPDNFDRDMRSLWYRNTEYCRLNNWSIYAIGNEIVADKVYDYGHLDEAVADLCRRFALGESLPMPRRRRYVEERAHYSAFYSPVTRALIARWYRREIEALHYAFEEAPHYAFEEAPQTPAAEGVRVSA